MASLVKKKKIAAAMIYISAYLDEATEENNKYKKVERKRSVWMRDCLEKRCTDGAYVKIIQKEFQEVQNQTCFFKNYIRMDEKTFKELLELVAPYIEKKNTIMRQAIPACERLAVTLRFLATGESFKILSLAFRIAQSTISTFIPVVCDAIYKALKDAYMQMPSNEEQWTEQVIKFNKKWNFPNCLGAVGGKHIEMNSPANSSIVLMAIADAEYKFIYIDVGSNGEMSNEKVFRKSAIQYALDNNSLQLPTARHLPDRELHVPFVLVGDHSFDMQIHLLKPYSGKNLTAGQRMFNSSLSRARCTIEKALSVMMKLFQIFARPIQLNKEKTILVTLACCALHNFIIRKNPRYIETFSVDEPGTTALGKDSQAFYQEVEQETQETFPTTDENNEAEEIRKEFKEYFALHC